MSRSGVFRNAFYRVVKSNHSILVLFFLFCASSSLMQNGELVRLIYQPRYRTSQTFELITSFYTATSNTWQ